MKSLQLTQNIGVIYKKRVRRRFITVTHKLGGNIYIAT